MALLGAWAAVGGGSKMRSLMNCPQVSAWQRVTDRGRRRRNSRGGMYRWIYQDGIDIHDRAVYAQVL